MRDHQLRHVRPSQSGGGSEDGEASRARAGRQAAARQEARATQAAQQERRFCCARLQPKQVRRQERLRTVEY